MDINWLINRIKNILVTPQTEWPVAGAEAHTAKDVFLKYAIYVAGAAAIAAFVSSSILGTSMFGMTVRQPVGIGIALAIIGFVGGLATVFLVGLLADVLAPSFGGERNQAQAVKLVAYSATAGWVGAVLGLLPWIGWLLALAGMIYGIYLVYLGAPHTTRVPADRAAGYTAVVVIAWLVLTVLVGALSGLLALGGGAASALSGTSATSQVEVDPDSALGKFEQLGKSLEQASKQLEAAGKSGDAQAQADAAQKMLGSLMGGGAAVEAVGTDVLKPLAPETLAGMARTSFSAEKSAAMGLQVSNVEAEYAVGDKRIRLQISDTGGASGIMGLASWAMVQTEREDDSGYEKVYKDGETMVQEKWNSASRSGEYNLIVAGRFVVNMAGDNLEMEDLKSAMAELDLDALAAMKDVGVQKG
jgi:hypothetical protein